VRFGHSFRLVLAVLLLVAVVQGGPIGITRYSGPDFPYSAGFFALTTRNELFAPTRAGTYSRTSVVDDGQVDTYSGGEPELQPWSGFETEVSAADPAVFYAHVGSASNGRIDVVRVIEDHCEVLRTIQFRVPVGAQFVDFVGVKLDRHGSDVVFFTAGSNFALSAILDTDGDGLADTILDRDNNGYDDHIRFGDFSILAVSGDGTGYGIEFENNDFPLSDRFFAMTVRDTDGDIVPDTPAWLTDPRGRRELPGVTSPFGSGAVDEGTGRIVLNYRTFYGALEIDGDGFPLAQAPRLVPRGLEGGSGSRLNIRTYYHPALLPDGSAAAFLRVTDLDTDVDSDGVYVFDDRDFSGQAELYSRDLGEVFPALTTATRQFDPPEYPGIPSAHELTELEVGDGGNEHVTFADFGIWPDGRPFSFRQAGVERTSVDVSANGLLSFVGPITASPSLASLDATPGLVAPAWSDQWDTSQVRVFAGCAPVQRRFADGSGSAALSFVVEWRGLISPNGKRTSIRCLLLEDGSFRVDYGAMEIGDMPIVVGYSTDGAGAIVTDDLSDNSWGGQPAGTLDEAKLGEEFGAAKPFDLAHKWIRFAGYGDVRGPRPEIVSAVLKKGNKIQMKAAGSNIQPDATLVVDGTETFELAKSATGSKWVVTKKARSTPGATSVADIWDDGAAHSIVVVNPDGGRSQELSLE